MDPRYAQIFVVAASGLVAAAHRRPRQPCSPLALVAGVCHLPARSPRLPRLADTPALVSQPLRHGWGAAPLLLPLAFVVQALRTPLVNDVSTDPNNPPQLHWAGELRTAQDLPINPAR